MPVVWRSRFSTSMSNPLAALEPSRAWLARFGFSQLPTPLVSGQWKTATGQELLVRSRLGDGTDVCSAAALRLRNPIPQQGMIWTTDVGFHRSSEIGLHGCITILQDAMPGSHPRFDVTQRVAPKVLSRLAESLPDCTIPLSAQTLTEGRLAKQLVDFITARKRDVPLVVVSEDNWTRRPLVNPERLAERLSGIAQVVLISKEVSRRLPDALAQVGAGQERAAAWGVFGGAVRVYLPSCDPTTGDPFAHPLFLPIAVQLPDFRDTLFEWVSFHAALAADPTDVDVATLDAEEKTEQLRGIPDVRAAESLLEDAAAKSVRDDEALRAAGERVKQLEERTRTLEKKLQAQQFDYETRLSVHAPKQEDDLLGFSQSGPPSLRYFQSPENKRYPALEFIEGLPRDAQHGVRLKLTQLPQTLAGGTTRTVEKVGGNSVLWEFKINGLKDFWVRFLFARSEERPEILILSGFTKKQNRLDPGEIDRAELLLRTAAKAGWR